MRYPKQKRQNLVQMDVDHEVTLRLHNHSTIMYFQQPVGFEFLSCRTRRNIQACLQVRGERTFSIYIVVYQESQTQPRGLVVETSPQGLEAACDKRTVGPHLSTLPAHHYYIYYYQHILESEYEKKMCSKVIISIVSFK